MSEKRRDRRLSAILAADIAGYTKLVETDTDGTVAAWKKARTEVIDPCISDFSGRIVKLTGDGFLAEFETTREAVKCAISIQDGLKSSPLEFRMGISLGDIVDDGEDIHGEGVNIAARIEAMADNGGISVSAMVFESVRNRIPEEFQDMGEHEVKHVSAPVRVYRIIMEKGAVQTEGNVTEELALPDKPSIAVLPFDNMSGDSEQEYFADGVVEALTAELSRIRDFFVIARNSAFVYKGQHKNAREIGRELGVAYLLEGSVQRAGGRVRITVQLIETEGDAHIWADRYDGSLDDIFDLQDRITEQVAGALQPSIRLAEIARSRRKRPQSMGAYDYTMRALSHVWLLEKEEADLALDLLNKALEITPEYPLALALAAWCHAQKSVYNWADDIAQARATALSLAEEAANISAEDPLVLTVLGTVHTFARNFGAARVLLERAVAIDSNAAWAYSRLGWLSTYADRPEEAQTYFEKSLRLSPVDPMNFNNYVGKASAFQVAGDDDAASGFFQRALDERPNAHWIHRNLAPSLLGAGKEQEARESFRIMTKAYPDLTVKRYKDAMVFSPQVLDRIGTQLAELGLPEE
ncbi:MAG: hypothetical protein HN725_12120 [Alphaproteobacteria bacterium]|nr:hypothetical protein [Alphaproteobacteria bacterium]MBT7067986.1 hypothetical protein [Verrucomicrobiota bacterium]MBT7746029.1 hypothetical protein [Alphaproteobacteria bacterium]